jgi:hypothetical protein
MLKNLKGGSQKDNYKSLKDEEYNFEETFNKAVGNLQKQTFLK